MIQLASLNLCLVAAMLAGCAQMPRHEVDISNQFRKQPVRKIVLLPVVFPSDVGREHPDDFSELKQENIAATENMILLSLRQSFGTSISIDASFTPDEKTLTWNKEIGGELLRGRVPLGTPSLNLPVEAVLITVSLGYGTKHQQFNYQLFPFLRSTKRRYIGRVSWNHICDLEFLLVRPSDGHIFCHVRHSETERRENRSAEALMALTARTTSVIAQALIEGPER